MNKQDRTRLDQIRSQADFLMNGKGNGITNADVVEALLWDLELARVGRDPEAIPALVELDEARNQSVEV